MYLISVDANDKYLYWRPILFLHSTKYITINDGLHWSSGQSFPLTLLQTLIIIETKMWCGQTRTSWKKNLYSIYSILRPIFLSWLEKRKIVVLTSGFGSLFLRESGAKEVSAIDWIKKNEFNLRKQPWLEKLWIKFCARNYGAV